MSLPDDYADRFAHRLLQDAYTEATALYWLRRAQAFEDARPRPDDYVGAATADDLAARDARLADSAETCRARARHARLVIAEWV